VKATSVIKAAAGIACGGLFFALAGCGREAAAPLAPGPAAAGAAAVKQQAPKPAYKPDPALAGAAGVINYSYQPGRDAAADIKEALARASASGRRVLVEVGGTWCSWCGVLDRHFAARPAALALRDAAFVTVKVYSKPSDPSAALAAYPKPPGYPHFYVLNADGTLAESRDTTTLEAGAGYDAARMDAFLRSWAPAAGKSGK